MSDLRTSGEWIDIHAHVAGLARFGVDAETYGATRGVGTLVDAGSARPENLAAILHSASTPRTTVLAWANICAEGIAGHGCAAHDISGAAARRAFVDAPAGSVVGIKLQASNTRLGGRALKAIRNAIDVAADFRAPLMVHVGNAPPSMREVLPLLRPGDIITHFAHGKPGGAVADGRVHPSLVDARARGVLFDIGHGAASFSFAVMEQLLANGFAPDIISTDLHRASADRPVGSLADCMSKLLGLGMTEDAVVAAVTSTPRAALGLPHGPRRTTYSIDEEAEWLAEDSVGATRAFHRRFVPQPLPERC